MPRLADIEDRASLLNAHPSPTFARPGWVSLDGDWEFALGTTGDDPLALTYDRSIRVPFAPESAASGIGVDFADEPRYRRTLRSTRRLIGWATAPAAWRRPCAPTGAD